MPGVRLARVTVAGAVWLMAWGMAAAPGCGGGNEQTICNADGCQVCDGYGCRPAEPSVNGTGGSDAGTTCDPSTTTCGCGTDGKCSTGLECMDGLCLKACEYSSECGGKRICLNGKCVVGCDTTTPCDDGYTCNAKGVCELEQPTCSVSVPCSGGLVCVKGVCQGGCTDNSGCATGEVCDSVTHTCMEDPQPMAPCAKDPTVCSAAQVCKDGYCRYPCQDSPECTKIDTRIPVCSNGICKSEAEANPECTKKEDCASGQDCVSNVCL